MDGVVVRPGCAGRAASLIQPEVGGEPAGAFGPAGLRRHVEGVALPPGGLVEASQLG